MYWFESNKKALQIYYETTVWIHQKIKDGEEASGQGLCDFTDKYSYTEWVDAWKELYKLLSAEQRESRIELSKPHDTIDVGFHRTRRYHNKKYLRILLKAREFGKIKSWALKQKNLVA